MPDYSKKSSTGGNKFAPKGAAGARSAGHRGHKPAEAGAPKKARWNADERATRGAAPTNRGERPNWEPRAATPTRESNYSDRGSRPSYGDRPDRGARTERPSYGDRNASGAGRSERPSYGDRNASGAGRSERPSYGDRGASTGRPSYGDRGASTGRPSYGDRPERTERPAYGDRNASDAGRTERPSYGDRPDRGARTERPSYGDRPDRGARTERPSYGDRGASTGRPSYGDRGASTGRPSYGDRPERTERPAYGDRNASGAGRTERPSYGDRPDRGARTERPSYGDRPDRGARTERPSYGDRGASTGRPSYGDRPERTERPARTERPSYSDRPARTERPSYSDRPARSDRTERPVRSFDDRRDSNTDRAARGSDFYPKRENTGYSEGQGTAAAGRFGPQDDVVLERLEAEVTTASDVVNTTFGDLGLGDNITRQLASMGAPSPFPIQAATIPDVLAGKDVLGRGKTGSGKTIAFGAPLVERLMENDGAKGRKPGRLPRALILAPTRELAMQIDRTVQPIARSVGLFTTPIFGGVPQFKQVSALQRGTDIIIATPGRLEDLVEQGRLDLSQVKIVVLDEADHMCDLGFLEPVQRILRLTADKSQKLLFSATLDKGVAQLVNEFLVEPAVHEVAGEDQASSTIDHRVLLIEQRDKRAIIEQLASGEGKTLIFARTRAFAEELADQLDDAGIPSTSLHGDLNQSRRTRNLQLLTSGRVNVLVATDVAARGIHVDDINLVIQADAPDEYKTYLHRSGRTGRAGKQGTVVTLISKSRRRRMDELLGRADIEATMVPAAPGDRLIDDLQSAGV
ncbi:DEAD/DEAH box helicase [Subtercola boreus]|uniref:RNA helicase n=1 Tax=Subtercola boreus TaxID=120213 RepID=A0A3E0W669_9MICO|nr:DEAD/DEAH box helicase [Subtercola boreus]RFA17940.1 RNA helicase [Subtercola boreus]RFA18322.1 RNA helicase [Subtercola boreus]RFA24852.1 RNA helicase [Subtercola boreus]